MGGRNVVVAIVAMVGIAGIAAFVTGYGWLVQEEYYPSDAKGGFACRYQTLRGIRVMNYLGGCPKFATTDDTFL